MTRERLDTTLQSRPRIALRIQDAAPSKKLVDFNKLLETDADVAALKLKVKAFAAGFGMPGRPFGKYNIAP